jgi:hypothetical protein
MESISLNKENNSSEIRLNKKFYDIAAVDTTIGMFKEFALCSYKVDKDVILLTLSALKDNDPLELSYEFFNHVLAVMKNQGMV